LILFLNERVYHGEGSYERKFLGSTGKVGNPDVKNTTVVASVQKKIN